MTAPILAGPVIQDDMAFGLTPLTQFMRTYRQAVRYYGLKDIDTPPAEMNLIECATLKEYNEVWAMVNKFEKIDSRRQYPAPISYHYCHMGLGDYDESSTVTFFDEERREEVCIIKVVCNDERLFSAPAIGELLNS